MVSYMQAIFNLSSINALAKYKTIVYALASGDFGLCLMMGGVTLQQIRNARYYSGLFFVNHSPSNESFSFSRHLLLQEL